MLSGTRASPLSPRWRVAPTVRVPRWPPHAIASSPRATHVSRQRSPMSDGRRHGHIRIPAGQGRYRSGAPDADDAGSHRRAMALEIGLVDALAEPGTALPAALADAKRLAAGPTQAYGVIKSLLAAGSALSPFELLDLRLNTRLNSSTPTTSPKESRPFAKSGVRSSERYRHPRNCVRALIGLSERRHEDQAGGVHRRRLAGRACPHARRRHSSGGPWPRRRAAMRLTYRELFDEACRVATALTRLTEPGDYVALWAPNVVEWPTIQYGAALAGVVLVA